MQPRFHRVAVGNPGGGVGGQGNGRRDGGNDPEIKDEHVRRQGENPQFDDGRDDSDGHHDITGGGRQAHPQYERTDHGQDQQNVNVLAAPGNEKARQADPQSRLGDGAQDDAHHGACDGDLNGAFSPVDKRRNQLAYPSVLGKDIGR